MTCVQRVTRMEPQQQDTQQIILCNVFSPEQTLVRLIQFIMIDDLERISSFSSFFKLITFPVVIFPTILQRSVLLRFTNNYYDCQWNFTATFRGSLFAGAQGCNVDFGASELHCWEKTLSLFLSCFGSLHWSVCYMFSFVKIWWQSTCTS